MTMASNKRIVFSSLLIALTILYYWLRFATGFVGGFAVLQLIFLALGATLGVLVLFNKGLLMDHRLGFLSPDFIIFAVLMHGILFIPFIFVRDGFYSALHSGIGTILPFFLYYYFARSFNVREKQKITFVIELILLFVAILYVSEFINMFVLDNGKFEYSIALNDYVINEIGGDGVSSSRIEGDVYDLVRLAGPLSHNNTTGLALAIGLVLSFGRIYLMKSKSAVLIFLFFSMALFMTGARTSILSGISGVFCVFVIRNGLTKATGEIFKFTKYMMLGFILLVMTAVYMGVLDISSFSQLYNYKNTANTLAVMAGKNTYEIYGDQIMRNPISLIMGLGNPSLDLQLVPFLSSFGDDDVFFMSILSRYGIIIPFLVMLSLLNTAIAISKNIRWFRLQNGPEAFILISPLGCVIAAFVSTIHTDAMFRPQIIPIIIILFAFAVDSLRSIRRSRSLAPVGKCRV